MEEVVEEGDWVQSMEITQIGWLEGLVGRKWLERHEVEASGLRVAILHILLQAFGCTYTLVAHLVTLRPSLKQSNSPRPFASVLHFM